MKNYVKVELLSKYFVSLFCGLKYAKKDKVYQTKLDTIFIKFIKSLTVPMLRPSDDWETFWKFSSNVCVINSN